MIPPVTVIWIMVILVGRGVKASVPEANSEVGMLPTVATSCVSAQSLTDTPSIIVAGATEEPREVGGPRDVWDASLVGVNLRNGLLDLIITNGARQ
jgi:hypothetical protein